MNNKIETIMVDSITIYGAEYDLEKQEMSVYFKNDSIYTYFKVPNFYWRGLFEAKSKGKFLNSYVFKKFTYNKLN